MSAVHSLSAIYSKDNCHHHCNIMENIICRLTYFALQRNVYLKFLGVLLKGLQNYKTLLLLVAWGEPSLIKLLRHRGFWLFYQLHSLIIVTNSYYFVANLLPAVKSFERSQKPSNTLVICLQIHQTLLDSPIEFAGLTWGGNVSYFLTGCYVWHQSVWDSSILVLSRGGNPHSNRQRSSKWDRDD